MVIIASAVISRMPRTARLRLVSFTLPPAPLSRLRRRIHRGPWNGRFARIPWALVSVLRYEDLPERFEVFDALAGAEHHGVERVVDQMDRYPGLLAQPLVGGAQRGSA